ncbi:MAG: DUF1648 domain-containing protein [Acidobacteria bacterium]|nr:MAG: DUF1648 domain-containing protein [Acidobacteriota bacterium]
MMTTDRRLPTTMESRPVQEIPRSSPERIIEVIALLGVALTVTLPISFWRMLPDRVPTHFGASGQPDARGSKVWVFALLVISILLYSSLSVLARFPHRFNHPWRITPENAEAQYRCARWLVLGLKTTMVWIFVGC